MVQGFFCHCRTQVYLYMTQGRKCPLTCGNSGWHHENSFMGVTISENMHLEVNDILESNWTNDETEIVESFKLFLASIVNITSCVKC